MAKEFTPKCTPTLFIKKDGSRTGEPKAVEITFRGRSAIHSKGDAMRLYANAWDRFLEIYEFPEKEEDVTAIFTAIGNYAHHIIKENGFASVISDADKLALSRLEATRPTTSDETEDGAPKESTTEETTTTAPKEAPKSAPKSTTEETKPAPKETPKNHGGKKKNSAPAEEGKGKPKKGTHTPTEENEEAPTEETNEEKPSEETTSTEDGKKSGSKKVLSAIAFIFIGLVVGVLSTAMMFGYGMFSDLTGHAETNSVTTYGTNAELTTRMVSCYGEDFLMVDLDKTKMSVTKSVIMANGASTESDMTEVCVTLTRGESISTENGSYLCYKGYSANTYVEIVVPLYSDGNGNAIHKDTLEKAMAARDAQFAEVKVTWLGETAHLSLVSLRNPQTYALTPSANK